MDSKGTNMSHLMSRHVLTTLAALTTLTAGCAGDQKTTETPTNPDAPADGSAPQPGDAEMPQPNGQPTETPPDAPPPQGLNEGSQGNVMAASGSPTGAATPSPQARLSEGQIAMIVDLANSAEIEQGKIAQTKAKSPSVKKFAAMMVKHHGEAKVETDKLMKQLSLTPVQSPSAVALKADSDKALGTLRGAGGAAFDVAYIDGQVVAHQEVLNLLDQQLLPSAQTKEVVDALQKARTVVASHLEQARALQAELAKTSK
jgi:putative membrane protein